MEGDCYNYRIAGNIGGHQIWRFAPKLCIHGFKSGSLEQYRHTYMHAV